MDVAITEASTANLAERRQRAARDGVAAEREEDEKRRRYPGPNVVPFVLESLGRVGESANALLRSLVPSDSADRAQVLGSARQSLSVLLQIGNAEQVLSSAR